MLISKRKYELEKQRMEQRIDDLEWLICKGEHEFVKVKCKLIADGQGYGDLYNNVYQCKNCGKIIEGAEIC